MFNFDNFDAKGMLDASREAIARAYHDADKKYREEEYNRQLQAILGTAYNDYYGILDATVTTINENPHLGLFLPLSADQLVPPDKRCVKVRPDGIPIFRLAVMLPNKEEGFSLLKFGKAMQVAFDKTCYGHYWKRLSLMGVVPLGNFLILTLTWGQW